MQNTDDKNKTPKLLDRMMKNLLGMYGILVNPNRIIQGILSHHNSARAENINQLSFSDFREIMRGKFSARVGFSADA